MPSAEGNSEVQPSETRGSSKQEPIASRDDSSEAELPKIVLPATTAPVQLNQQQNNISIQQIPPSTWDRLSPEQIVEITKIITSHLDQADERQFKFAMEQIKRETSGKKIAIVFGTIIFTAGLVFAAVMSLKGHETIALIISVSLATIVSMVVGKRFLD